MKLSRQSHLEKWISKHHHLSGQAMEFCASQEEATFLMGSLMQDYIRKFQFLLSNFVGPAEAKATLKIMLDTVLMDYMLVTAYIENNAQQNGK